MDHNKLWKILQDHLTSLLRNLYAGQEATVKAGHGKTDWFQIRKGAHQGCILLPCLSGTQKSNPSLQKEVEKNIKVEKRDKRGRDGVPSREGSLKERSFQTPGNLLTAESVPSFGSTEGNIKGREKKKINN